MIQISSRLAQAITGALLLTLSLGLIQGAAYARGFAIENAQASFSQTSLSVTARFNLQLSDAVDEALHNGVNIQLLTTLDMYTKRPYLWDKHIAQWAFAHEIEYHSLTNRYILRSPPQQDESRSFSSLNDLLNEIEHFYFQSDILSETLPASQHGYRLKLRIILDSSALPAPLRVMNYVSPSWRLRSNVHEWSVMDSS